MSNIQLINLTKIFGKSTAVEGLNLQIAQGEYFSLLGPSGCGKSTTLRMIAGFIRPTSGRIMVGGSDVTLLPPERRDVGIVFQNYAIFPHMSAGENIAFGLKLRKWPKDKIRKRVREVLVQVGLSGYEDRHQRELSGGEQQRVALARVLVTEPRILLLDEPLSALDRGLREEMKYWIKELQQKLGITTIFVTHDQDEALTMSDRIGVMEKARIVQIGTPQEIYEHPKTLFVTTSIGHSNLIDVTVCRKGPAGLTVTLAGIEIPASGAVESTSGQRAKLVIRPENVQIGRELNGSPIRLSAKVLSEIYQGPIIRYLLELDGQEIIAERQNRSHLERFVPGTLVTVGWDPERSKTLIA